MALVRPVSKRPGRYIFLVAASAARCGKPRLPPIRPMTFDHRQARRRAAHLWRLGVYASVKVIEVEWHGVRCIRRDVVLARGATERPQPYPAAAE